MRIILKVSILFIFLNGCSSSYEYLTKNSLEAPDEFSRNLVNEYKSKAIFESEKMHDWNSAKLYSEKALEAVKGNRVIPEKINTWKIPKEKFIELNKAYENLMKVYETAINTNPYDLAVAISSLDCWSEQQEENWQTWDINECRNNYLKAMHKIYNNISAKEKKIKEINNKEELQNSTIILTKDSNDEIKQIIYFDFDKSNLNNINLKELESFLNKNQYKINKYLIVGHTDTKGTKQYNMKLSTDRAETIKKFLIKFGIDKKYIKILARGEEEPAILTEDEIAHPANRRVEISKIN